LKLDQSYGLKIADLREGEMIEDGPAEEYPALLLWNMGVEKRLEYEYELRVRTKNPLISYNTIHCIQYLHG
jgi:hypothetical protein